MRIVVINGAGGAGKDLFVAFCASHLGTDKVKNYSTVDYVKAVAAGIGWDGTKDDKNRKFLSDLKKILTEWDDVPYRKTKLEIEDFQDKMNKLGGKYAENSVMFIHCREPKEIDRLVKDFNASTLLIRRKSAEEANWQNQSDQEVLNYQYNAIIFNDGSLEQLRESAKGYLKGFLGLNI
jgi:hypothetical protein